MFAVIKTGGKQYRIATNDIIRVERLPGEAGDIVELGSVLMVGGDDGLSVGAPLVAGASVAAEVLRQDRADRIIVFKKKRRQNYRRRKGHRQHETVLRVTEILTDGKKPSMTKTAPMPATKVAGKADAGKAKAAKPKAPAKTTAPAKAAAKATGEKKAAAKKSGAGKTTTKKE